MKKITLLFILVGLFIKINAQNNIIPNGNFESGSSSICIIGDGNADDFDDNVSNWKVADHNIDKKEGAPDWIKFSVCQYNNYCEYFAGLIVNSDKFVAIKADIHQCKAKATGGYKIKRTHEAIVVGLDGGAAFTAYQYYTIRYKIIPINARNIDAGGDPLHTTCVDLKENCHLRVFLTKKGTSNWNDSYGNIQQEVVNANYVIDSGPNPICNWVVVERTFVVNYSGMKNLVLFAESGGFIIDDVEIFPKCDDDYLIQNKNYYFPLYAPDTQDGNHFSEQSMNYINAGFNVGLSSVGTGDVVVGSGSAIVYTAQNRISLQPGFKVENGGYFHAIIDYCPNSHRASNDIDTTNILNTINETNVLFLTEQQTRSDITIAPNPSNGTFNIMLSQSYEHSNIKEAKIFNVLGEIVLEKENIFSNEFNVDISQQPKGVYYIRIVSTIDDVQIKKIVTQ